jgi:hypothetical protein
VAGAGGVVSLLPTATAAAIRAVVTASLTAPDATPLTAIVRTAALGTDTGLGPPTTTTDSAPIPCRLHVIPVRPMEGVFGEQLSAKQRWLVVFPLGAAVVPGPQDQIVIGSRTFEVQEVNAGKSLALEIQIICEEIR